MKFYIDSAAASACDKVLGGTLVALMLSKYDPSFLCNRPLAWLVTV